MWVNPARAESGAESGLEFIFTGPDGRRVTHPVGEALLRVLSRDAMELDEELLRQSLTAALAAEAAESKANEGEAMTMTVERKREAGGGGIDRSRVRLVSQVVELQDRTGRALDIMNADELSFLPVVAEDTGKLLGVVLRKGIERGCWGMGHDPDRCPVQNHLKTGIRFCFEDEQLDPGMVEVAVREPVVVVDRHLRPLGILLGEEGR